MKNYDFSVDYLFYKEVVRLLNLQRIDTFLIRYIKQLFTLSLVIYKYISPFIFENEF